jgi:hypothetical protein
VVVSDASLQTLFPSATSLFAFSPATGYESVTALEPGRGYWINLPASTTRTVSGTQPSSMQVELPSGWSMLGPLAAEMDVSELGDDVISLYRFSGGYEAAASLHPGEGYWVNLSGAASLYLDGGVAMGEVEIIGRVED